MASAEAGLDAMDAIVMELFQSSDALNDSSSLNEDIIMWWVPFFPSFFLLEIPQKVSIRRLVARWR